MTDDEIKLFKRYLKERGIYSDFLREIKKYPERRVGLSIKYAFKSITTVSEPMMDFISWNCAKNQIWQHEYHMYRDFIKNIYYPFIDGRIFKTTLDKKEFLYEMVKHIEKFSKKKN